jgi:hypothetical protein
VVHVVTLPVEVAAHGRKGLQPTVDTRVPRSVEARLLIAASGLTRHPGSAATLDGIAI